MSQRTNVVTLVTSLAYTLQFAPFGEGVSTACCDDSLLSLYGAGSWR